MKEPLSQRSTYTLEKSAQDQVFVIAVIPKEKPSEFPLYWLHIKGLSPPQPDEKLADLPAYSWQYLNDILVDPLLEELHLIPHHQISQWYEMWRNQGFLEWAEKQYLPGVTDNLAHTVEEALRLKQCHLEFAVASGRGYLSTESGTFNDAAYKLFHPLVEKFNVHDLRSGSSQNNLSFPFLSLIAPEPVLEINLNVSDEELLALSTRRLLALNLSELQVIADYFQQDIVQSERLNKGLPAQPTDVELEIIAQTWSEHCKHKIFNASITYTAMSDDDDLCRTHIKSLYKTYIQGATSRLLEKRKDLLSVFKDNSGIVKWDENWAVCFKVETHNSPCALEPYGGGITGILGVNRDILGTGLGAKPIFNTDILCFAHPANELTQRPKLLPPQTIIDGVRKAIQDGGNKSGIPTVNGAVIFDNGYRAKPLVFCGTGGLLPLKIGTKPAYLKHTKPGDTIVMAGGRVGKDGIHGATFSSEALHEGSPVSAVQIGDPFTQKRLSDFIIEARDQGFITGITDNGAGGLSSSVGEMAEITGGATIELNLVPTKYPGLADWEKVISESQERMTISTNQFNQLKELGKKHNVELSAIGEFNTSGKFEITSSSKLVASLDLNFLHHGGPVLELKAKLNKQEIKDHHLDVPEDLHSVLLQLLSHPNICSRESVIRRYDHEVQGRSVIKPLMGQLQQAPCDAAVVLPVLGGKSALAISNGICPQLSTVSAYLMAVCAVDEAIRNAVCVGADPDTVVILDNFCWPDPIVSKTNANGEHYLAQLVECCQGLFDAATAFEAPIISGKDSMKNDFDDGVVRLSIKPTLLISALSKVSDAEQAVSMEFKNPGDIIYLIASGSPGLAQSSYEQMMQWNFSSICQPDLPEARTIYQKTNVAITNNLISSAHDLSDGGLAVAISECCIGSNLGAKIHLDHTDNSRLDLILFGEGPGRLLLSVPSSKQKLFETCFKDCPQVLNQIGIVQSEPTLVVSVSKPHNPQKLQFSLTLNEMTNAWNAPLPFSQN